MQISKPFLRRLQQAFSSRRLDNGAALLDAASSELASFKPHTPRGADLLLCLAQWVDIGYRDPEFLEGLIKRFPTAIRAQMPLGEYLRLRMTEAFMAMSTENASGAIEILEFVIKAERELDDPQLIALSHFWLGRAHRKKGEYESALKHIVEARRLTESLQPRPAAIAVIQIQESWLLFQFNQRKNALRLLDEAEAGLAGADYPLALANIESARGRIIRRSGAYGKALEHFDRAISIYSDRHPQHRNLARTLVNSAYVKRLVALQLRKRIDAKAKPGGANGAGDFTNRAADRSLHMRYLGIYRDAFNQLQQAEKIYSMHRYHGGVASALRGIGQLHLDNGEIDKAESVALEAYKLAVESDDRILMARARILQAAVENAQVDEQLGEEADTSVHAALAIQHCDQALSLAELTQNRRLLARAYLMKGAIAANDFLEDWEEAKECIAKAAPLLSGGDRDQLWDELVALKAKVVHASGVEDALRAWSEGIVGDKSFQQITEEFAEIVIPRVWNREGRKISRVAERLSISPKKVRRILRNVGLLVTEQVSRFR